MLGFSSVEPLPSVPEALWVTSPPKALSFHTHTPQKSLGHFPIFGGRVFYFIFILFYF